MRFKALIIISIFLFFIQPVFSHGILLPDYPIIKKTRFYNPLVSLIKQDINIKIKDNYSKTSINQTFFNNYNQNLSGKYIFPLQNNAVISSFSMLSNGKELSGKIYDKSQARKIYEEIVRKQKDPGLLELLNKKLFQVDVYPILAKKEMAININYEQLLKKNNNLYRYNYSFSKYKSVNSNNTQTNISIDIKTKEPLKTIYSPSHKIKIRRIDKYHSKVSFESNKITNQDFILYYSVSKNDLGIDLLTFSDESEKKGYFMLILAPKFENNSKKVIPKDLVFVLDTSGSMSGKKIKQAKEALKFCVSNLNKQDRYNIVTFSDFVEKQSDYLLNIESKNINSTLDNIDDINASGGTNIDEALKISLNSLNKNKQSNLLFLTDGQPTVGVTNIQEILKNSKKYNKYKTKVFVFGVGFNVNIQFLDKLSQNNNGYSEYVRPEENIETVVSSIFNKINDPVLTDLNISYNQSSDIYPRKLPDLFKGSQIIILGRYNKNNQDFKVNLSGLFGEETKKISETFSIEPKSNNSFIPRLWAARKIGYLLDEIRLKGKNDELVDEVIRISKKYGIVTEFTSFLITEESSNSNDETQVKDRVKRQLYESKKVSKGSWAISQSRNNSKLKVQSAAPSQSYYNKSGKEVDLSKKVKNIAEKTFYKEKEYWVDSIFEDKKIVNIKAYSQEYFTLINENTYLNKYLIIGSAIKINIEGKNYIIK